MKLFKLCLAVVAVSMVLSAQMTGRITGKVTDTSGKPITDAKVVIQRLDITFLKEIKVDRRGNFLQAGLEPKEYELSITADGFVGHKEIVKIPLNDFITRNITLKTPDEALASSGQPLPAGTIKASQGDSAYTEAVRLFNDRSYLEAMPQFESAIENYREVIANTKEGDSVAETERLMTIAVNSLATCQFEIGRMDLERRSELWHLAEPVFLANLEKLPKDDKSQDRARLASQLMEIARMKGDTTAEKRYNDILAFIEGPKAENSYNIAVELYNAGKMTEAKPHLIQAIKINPDFAETYYLLAICEFADMNLKGSKENLQKYLELAPNGKYAAEVREMLAESDFKNIK